MDSIVFIVKYILPIITIAIIVIAIRIYKKFSKDNLEFGWEGYIFNNLKKELQKYSTKTNYRPNEILNEYFYLQKKKVRNGAGNKGLPDEILFWQKVNKIDQKTLIDALENKILDQELLQKFKSIVYNSEKALFLENNVIQPIKDQKYFQDKIFEWAIQFVKNKDAGSFLRLGFFAKSFGCYEPDLNMKTCLKSWKIAVSKYIQIPKNFATTPTLIGSPFYINGKNWKIDGAKKALSFFYLLFNSISCDYGIKLMVTEVAEDDTLKEHLHKLLENTNHITNNS